MLNHRQLEILLELFERHDSYLTASFFAQKQRVSLRTIQNDMRSIKEELSQHDCVAYESVSPKGSHIIVRDEKRFASLKEDYYFQLSNSTLVFQNERIGSLIFALISEHRAISLYDLESRFHVSHSTLLNDLKQASQVLSQYNLSLMRSSNRVSIDGSEINKRHCITKQNLIINVPALTQSSQDAKSYADRIRRILVDVLVGEKKSISEAMLNNAIMVLSVSLYRMENWFFILPGEIQAEDPSSGFMAISREVYKEIEREFHIRVPEEEIAYFAIFIKGQGAYAPLVVSDELDHIILKTLQKVEETYGIDLTNDLNLRLALALHCAPLLVRVKYDMQLQDNLVDYIRQNYPQGYDIAAFFAKQLEDYCGKRIKDEEIAYIAIHLYNVILEQQKKSGAKHILVVSAHRRSQTTMLRQTLYNWFSDRIAELTFIRPEQFDPDMLDRYDVILVTEKQDLYEKGIGIFLDVFPDRQAYLNIRLAIDGFQNFQDVIDIFPEDLFFRVDGKDRDGVIHALCSGASALYDLTGLEEEVHRREDMRSTYFGSKIAAMHPMAPVSDDTFMAVGVTDQAISWDAEGNMVNLILLVGIGRNNHKAFHLWNYLSRLFADRSFADNLLQDPTYDNFLRLFKAALTSDLR